MPHLVTPLPTEQTCGVWHGGRDFRVERQPVPPIGPRDVLLDVAVCGVCGTDLHIVDGDFPLLPAPRVLGHEYAGTVRAIGSAVTSVAVGQRVAVEPTSSCGACFYCREGLPLLCQRRTPHHGGLGEYAVVPETVVFPLPPNVSLEAAALAEPLSCCLHAINLANIRPGYRVAILGAGAMGLLLLQLARRAGATRVLVSDLAPARRAMAARLGADLVVDPAAEDVRAAALDLSAGIGVDVALEAVGARQTVLDCLALPRRAGTAVLVGVAPPGLEVPLRPYDVYERALTIKGSFIRAYEFQRAVELLPFLELEPLITDQFPLAEAPAALEHVRARKGIKTVVRPR